MSKKYINSPLTEVVAEFSFIPDKPWNSTVPGVLYSKLQKDFPVIKQRQDQILIANPTEEKPQERVEMDLVQLVQFWNEQNSLLSQAGKDMLTVNALKPYPTWEQFSPLIQRTFNAYCEAASPKGLRRANLRYINTIELPKNELTFDGNFEISMPKPAGFEYPIRFINTHVEFNLNEIDVLAQKFTSVPNENPKVMNLVLQIEVVMNKYNGLKIENVGSWLSTSHDQIIGVFESTVNDNLKKRFDM